MDVAAAAERLREYPLPAGCVTEETADLLARMVDEPRRETRMRLFPLISELFASGVFSPPRVLKEAVEGFLRDNCSDPMSCDPPELPDIALRELLPALGLSPRSLSLPGSLADLLDGLD